MMVAACHRRTGNYQQAYRCYSATLDQFPDSEECVRHLIRLAAEMRLTKQYAELSERLQRLQRNREMREKRSQSAMRSSALRKTIGKHFFSCLINNLITLNLIWLNKLLA